jgi:hypothetical protein
MGINDLEQMPDYDYTLHELQKLREKYPAWRDDQILMLMVCQLKMNLRSVERGASCS